MFRVYITDALDTTLFEERRALEGLDVDLVVANCTSEEEVATRCADADALLVGWQRIGELALTAMPRCRVVVRQGIGTDPIDIEACTRLGVCVANVPDYCIDEVSDHTLALLLACARRIVRFDRDVRTGLWSERVMMSGMERLTEQTLGIVGFGRIGRAVAAKARPFGWKLLASDPYLEATTGHGNGSPVDLVPFNELLSRSDYVAICCPLTASTYHLFDRDALAAMKSTAFLINTARGGIVDQDALLDALTEGGLSGAALDVLEEEPPPLVSPLRRLPNVIVTPHAAYYSRRSHAQVHYEAAREVARVLQGNYPRSLVNPRVKPRLQELQRELVEMS